ncbi:MAG: hypothetical protein ACF788_08805 [Novipirellula sp. JB048]
MKFAERSEAKGGWRARARLVSPARRRPLAERLPNVAGRLIASLRRCHDTESPLPVG